LLALGDIAQDDGEEFSSSSFGLGNRSFNREFCSVGPQSPELADRTHTASGHAGVAESVYMSGMCSAESVRNKAIQRMSKDLARLATKHFFGGAVEKDYPLL